MIFSLGGKVLTTSGTFKALKDIIKMKQKWTKYEDESFQLFIYTIWKQKLYQYD